MNKKKKGKEEMRGGEKREEMEGKKERKKKCPGSGKQKSSSRSSLRHTRIQVPNRHVWASLCASCLSFYDRFGFRQPVSPLAGAWKPQQPFLLTQHTLF